MKAAKHNTTNSPRAVFFITLLLVILAALFCKSFLPGYVHFSNDGPLGLQNTAQSRLPDAFTGSWGDLNIIGASNGAAPLGLSTLISWALGPVAFSKFYAPVALFILGLGAWTFFRQLRLSPLAAVLGGLAAALNSSFFSRACWGIGAHPIAIGMDFFALGLIVANTPQTPALTRWVRLALAGLAIGAGVMEGADVGAILSLFVAVFVFYKALTEDIIQLLGTERIVVLCCVNGLFLFLFVLGIVFGFGIFKLCLLFILLLIATITLNWSLTRKLVHLTTIERIVTLSLVNLAFFFLLLFAVLHGFGVFLFALLLIVGVLLNWALLCYPLFVNKCGFGVIRLSVVAIFAGFIALQTIVSLVGFGITGVVGTGQDKETKAANWDKATEWSLPKKETLGFLVPGLFGYRMDTPTDMMTPSLQDHYKGGEYWGGAGRDPAIDRYFDKIFEPGDMVKINFPDDSSQDVALTIGPDGNVNLPLLGSTKLAGISGSKLLQTINPAYASKGIKAYVESPGGIMRFNGDGNYLGILVALLAAFAIAQSLRREKSPFTMMQKKFVWFWAAVMVVALLLAWGRFALFYQFFYALPYVSTIRNPVKFIFAFSWAVVILSGFGVHVLSRRYLEVPAAKTNSFTTQLINWWAKVRGFDRKWTMACAVAVIGSLLAWLIYSAQKSDLIRYLQMVGYPDEGMAKGIADFSLGQTGWFILFFALAAGLFTLVIAGIFSGKRAKLGGVLLGGLLVLDLGRANLPFIIHWDYVQKYASNPIIDFLKDKPYEHRVASLPFETQQPLRLYDNAFGGNGVYRIEWMQHHFLYYNIQSLDIIQMPRMAADLAAFENALAPHNTADTTYLMPRRWQLTNTRYLLGPAGFLDALNTQLDPVQHRFRIAQRFDIIAKPGIMQPTQLEELTASPSNDGDLALFEFTGALPRAKLYSNWQVSTNDDDALKTLADKNFDPLQTVLVSSALPAAPSTNGNSGTVEFKSYSPKDIVFDATADTSSVLLLNDKFDPHWSVSVDGKPAELLRCNFIMRGVYLPPGAHTVEFHFTLPHRPLYVTLAAIGVGLILLGVLKFLTRRDAAQSPVG